MKINLLFFTSTGNTLFLAEHAKTIFEKRGHSVELIDAVTCDYTKSLECDILGVIYPVWASNLPNHIQLIINKLLIEPKKLKIFFIGNCAGFSGDTGHYWRKKLEKSGHTVLYNTHIKMPSNFNIWKILSQKLSKKKIEKIERKALFKIERICGNILEGNFKNTEKCIFCSIISRTQRKMANNPERISSYSAKRLSYQKEKCTKCGLCTRICPVENITLDMENGLCFSNKCILCVKCYNYCPTQSIFIGNQTKDSSKFRRYHSSHNMVICYKKDKSLLFSPK